MTAPRLTILMPTLNGARYICDALRSVREGNLATGDVEVLVLDGGSTDGTVELALGFGPLTRVSVERDDSLYAALNRGLGLARGELIGWLNADDVFSRSGPAKLLAASEEGVDFVFGHYENWSEATNRRTQVRQPQDALERYRRGDLETGFITPLSIIWRRRVLERLGGWNPRYRITGDQELWVRAAAIEPMLRGRHVDSVVGTFRTHPGSLSTGGRHLDRMHMEAIWLSEMAVGLSGAPLQLIAAYQDRLRDSVRWSVVAKVARGRFADAQAVMNEFGGPSDSILRLVATHFVKAGLRRLRRAAMRT